jgi:glycosyltransferase involved in cell wall biosynthesis
LSQRRSIAVDYRMSRSSGIGVYLREIVRRLATRHQHQVSLELLGGVPFPGVAQQPYRAPIYSVAELIEPFFRVRQSTDVLWCPNYNAPLASAGALVVTVHDLCHLALPELFGSRVKSTYARLMFANVKRRASKVICVSEFTASELVRLTGIERERIVVIKSGIDDRWSQPILDPRPIPEPYILCVGNVKPHKNLKGLLKAFDALKDRIPHRLVVIGKIEGLITPDRHVLDLAERLQPRVSFTGEVGDEELRRFYAHADLLAHPSLYEGFGFPPLEAMAVGIPVAASRAASIPEICGDAVAYFNPLDIEEMAGVILKTLESEETRKTLRERGRRQVTQYSWTLATDRVVQVFRDAAAS